MLGGDDGSGDDNSASQSPPVSVGKLGAFADELGDPSSAEHERGDNFAS